MARRLPVLLLLSACGPGADAPAPEAPGDAVAVDADAETLTLYFPDGSGRLGTEQREWTRPPRAEDSALGVLAALMEGPRKDVLYPPLPDGTSIDGVRLNRDGVAYVELVTEPDAGRPRLGSRQELLAVYSLVNTLCANVPQVQSVAFLWNGAQAATFAGNVDTRRPLLPDAGWIAADPGPDAETR